MKNLMIAAILLPAMACTEQTEEQATPAGQVFAETEPIASDAPLDIAITQFPTAYNGRWGMTPGDCILGASDAKGLISIQGSLVKFYESVGTMRNGKRETLFAISSDFEMVGEGQKWQTHARYQLETDRKSLIRQDSGTGQRFAYTRCLE